MVAWEVSVRPTCRHRLPSLRLESPGGCRILQGLCSETSYRLARCGRRNTDGEESSFRARLETRTCTIRGGRDGRREPAMPVVHLAVRGRGEDPHGFQQIALSASVCADENVDQPKVNLDVLKGLEGSDGQMFKHSAQPPLDGHRPRCARSSAAVTTCPRSKSPSPSAIASASRAVIGSSSAGALANAAATGLEIGSATIPRAPARRFPARLPGSMSTNRGSVP